MEALALEFKANYPKIFIYKLNNYNGRPQKI